MAWEWPWAVGRLWELAWQAQQLGAVSEPGLPEVEQLEQAWGQVLLLARRRHRMLREESEELL